MSQDPVEHVLEANALLLQQNPTPFPLPVNGIEALVAGGFLGVEKTDWVFPGLRERVGAVLRNCPIERLVDGHAGARPYRVAPVSTSASTRLLQACGVAMASEDGTAVLCFVGQGAAATGSFYEALNLAALHNLNLIVLAHRRDLSSEDSPIGPQVAGELSAKAESFGIRTQKVNGSQFDAVQQAVSQARTAGGPHFIEASLD